jgi:hypothetical protein
MLEALRVQAKAAPVVTDTMSWLESPAVQPGGALAVEKRAALGPFDVVPGRLVAGKSGVHRYGLTGVLGIVLSAKVATDAFEPVVVVIAPSGRRWDISSSTPGANGGANGSAAGTSELVLPESGEYMLVVTSRENTKTARAVTNGEYRLTLLCDAPKKAPVIPPSPPSSRSGRFAAWESEPR